MDRIRIKSKLSWGRKGRWWKVLYKVRRRLTINFHYQNLNLIICADWLHLIHCSLAGLGFHGLTHLTNEHGNFISLHSAVKSELQLHIEIYKHAINIIDESESHATSDPQHSSHQRLLSFKYDDIQKRLINNKILLTKLEVHSLKRLHEFIDQLRERVEKDKEALVCLNHIKKFDRDVNFREWWVL